MGDDKHLKRRGDNYWYFQLAVPRALQAQYGRKVIIEALHTTDIALARKLRTPREGHYERVFDRMRSGLALTADDINEEARRAYEGELSSLRRYPQRLLDEGITEAVGTVLGIDIDMIATRRGVTLDPAGPVYQSLES